MSYSSGAAVLVPVSTPGVNCLASAYLHLGLQPVQMCSRNLSNCGDVSSRNTQPASPLQSQLLEAIDCRYFKANQGWIVEAMGLSFCWPQPTSLPT